MYSDNDDTKEFSVALLAMVADLTSIKAEVQEVASETADEMRKLKERAEELKDEEEVDNQ